jgi:hypothetical protein
VIALVGGCRRDFSTRAGEALRQEGIAVNTQELERKYARLLCELAALEDSDHGRARHVRLAFEFEQIGQQLAAFRRLAQTAPTLQDVVMARAKG